MTDENSLCSITWLVVVTETLKKWHCAFLSFLKKKTWNSIRNGQGWTSIRINSKRLSFLHRRIRRTRCKLLFWFLVSFHETSFVSRSYNVYLVFFSVENKTLIPSVHRIESSCGLVGRSKVLAGGDNRGGGTLWGRESTVLYPQFWRISNSPPLIRPQHIQLEHWVFCNKGQVEKYLRNPCFIAFYFLTPSLFTFPRGFLRFFICPILLIHFTFFVPAQFFVPKINSCSHEHTYASYLLSLNKIITVSSTAVCNYFILTYLFGDR